MALGQRWAVRKAARFTFLRPDYLSVFHDLPLCFFTADRVCNQTGDMVPQLHRHQVSLESVIDPLATPPLSSYDRARSQLIFQHIVQYCESYELLNIITSTRQYKRGRLLQLVYDHVISDHGRDNILRYFLSTMTAIPEENSPNNQDFSHVLSSLSDFKDRNTLEKDGIVQRVQELADHLVDSFFLPRKLSAPLSLIHNS